MEQSRSMMPMLLMGVLETAVNTIVGNDQAMVDAIAPMTGKVVRVKTSSPDMSLYIVFCVYGIQVLSQFDGRVDARIRAPAARLLLYAMGSEKRLDELPGRIIISGNEQVIDALDQLSHAFNIWQLVHQLLVEWLPDHTLLTDLLALLERSDPAWVDKLVQIVGSVDLVNKKLDLQLIVQEKQLAELSVIREALSLQERRAYWSSLFGGCLVALGLVQLFGWVDMTQLWAALSPALLALLVIGLVLVIRGVGSSGFLSRQTIARLGAPRNERKRS